MKWEIPGKKARPNPLAFRNLIHALQTEPLDYYELADTTGLHSQTIRRWLLPFRKASHGVPKLVRIAEWHDDPRGYPTRPAFAWGSGPDAKRAPLSGADRSRRVRQRKAMQRMIHATAGPAADA